MTSIHDPLVRRLRGAGYRVSVKFVGRDRPPRGNGPLPFAAHVENPPNDSVGCTYYGATEVDALRHAASALGVAL